MLQWPYPYVEESAQASISCTLQARISSSCPRRFPADRIKIAQCFTQFSQPGNAAVVRATIGLARELGMGVIAEGIETRAQVDELLAYGCAAAQGFYFSEPLPALDLEKLLRSGVIFPASEPPARDQAA